jgi:5-dehydro-2-deoxygluconokinase
MALSRLSQGSFLVIGRAGMDLFTEPGVALEDAGQLRLDLGGSAANIAVGLCKLGVKAALVTRVSQDSIGDYCIERLKHYGVDTRHVTPIGGEYRNSLAIYESVIENHRNVLYRNGAADFQMDDSDVSAVDYGAYAALVTAGTVFAAEPSRSATFHAIELARAAGLPIVFDVDYRPYSWPSAQVASEVLSRAAAVSDVIVGNDEEFGFMAGDYAQGLAKAKELAGSSATIVVYKMGPEGAITFAGDQELRTGVFETTALKPTGAGDSFMAGLLGALAQGRDLKTAVLRGSACAAITVSKPGCAPAMPTSDDLKAYLASQPGPDLS